MRRNKQLKRTASLKKTPIKRKKKSSDSNGVKVKKPRVVKPFDPEKPSWGYVKARVKPKFEKAGLLNVCELEYKQFRNSDGTLICSRGRREFLTFAHSLKRNKIAAHDKPAVKMEEVIRACVACHQRIEGMPPEVMYDLVREVIEMRIIPVERLYED